MTAWLFISRGNSLGNGTRCSRGGGVCIVFVFGWGIRVSVRIQWILLFFPFLFSPGLEHHLPHLLLIGADWIKRSARLSSWPQSVVDSLRYHLVLFSSAFCLEIGLLLVCLPCGGLLASPLSCLFPVPAAQISLPRLPTHCTFTSF